MIVAGLVVFQARGGVDLLAVRQRHDVAGGVDRRAVLEIDDRIELRRRSVVGLLRIHLLRAALLFRRAASVRRGRHLRRKRAGRRLAALRNLRERVHVVLALRQKRLDAAWVGRRASCSVPRRPPGDAEAAIDSCASFSQLVPVADAMLIEAMAMDAGPDSPARNLRRPVNEFSTVNDWLTPDHPVFEIGRPVLASICEPSGSCRMLLAVSR